MALFENFFEGFFKRDPVLPPYNRLDLAQEQQKATTGNIAALPGLETLATRTNAFNQAERLKALRDVIPDLDENIAQLTKNLGAGLKGEIPEDVAREVQNQVAARTLGRTGTSLFESGQGIGDLGRQLGLTSIGIQQQAQDDFQSWLQQGAQILTGPQFNVASAFVSPLQQAEFDIRQEENLWNYNWFKAQQDAALDPWARSLAQLGDNILNVAAAYVGGGGFGMGGGGPTSRRSGMPPGSEGSFGGSGEGGVGFNFNFS